MAVQLIRDIHYGRIVQGTHSFGGACITIEKALAALEAQLAREPVSVEELRRIYNDGHARAERGQNKIGGIKAILDHLNIPHDGQKGGA